jgi:hypothetical protein
LLQMAYADSGRFDLPWRQFLYTGTCSVFLTIHSFCLHLLLYCLVYIFIIVWLLHAFWCWEPNSIIIDVVLIPLIITRTGTRTYTKKCWLQDTSFLVEKNCDIFFA